MALTFKSVNHILIVTIQVKDDRMDWVEVKTYGMEWEWDQTRWDGMELEEIWLLWDGMEWNGIRWCEMGWGKQRRYCHAAFESEDEILNWNH